MIGSVVSEVSGIIGTVGNVVSKVGGTIGTILSGFGLDGYDIGLSYKEYFDRMFSSGAAVPSISSYLNYVNSLPEYERQKEIQSNFGMGSVFRTT